VIGGLGFVLGSRTSSNSNSDSAATTADASANPSWLLTQTAKFGSMTPNADGTYQLSMGGVDSDVIAFTDRPNRATGILTVPQMTKAWASAFADSAPNGVLVAHRLGAPADSIVVELFNPQFDGTTMTYTVRVLADENTSKNIVGDTSTTQVPTPPATFLVASLFIDNINLRYACMKGEDEVYPPGDVPAGGPTQDWYAQCKAAGGGIGETFG
jgi:hypothetical protein